MRPQAAALGRETERQRDGERLERLHLAVEPRLRVRALPVGPAQAGAEVPDAELLQPADAALEPRVLEVEPLADPEVGRQLVEERRGALRLGPAAPRSGGAPRPCAPRSPKP